MARDSLLKHATLDVTATRGFPKAVGQFRIFIMSASDPKLTLAEPWRMQSLERPFGNMVRDGIVVRT